MVILQVILYTQHGSTVQALCERASACFDLDVSPDIQVNNWLFQQNSSCSTTLPLTCKHAPEQVVHLKTCHLVLPKTYPSWTLVGQALGSVRLAYEGLQQAVPQVDSLRNIL